MAKRQRRYTAAKVIEKKGTLAGKSGSVVLIGGQVFEGKLLTVKKDYLLLENGLQQTQQFQLASIEEIIIETHI